MVFVATMKLVGGSLRILLCSVLTACLSSAGFGAVVLTAQGEVQVGSNYIDFGNLAGTSFTPVPGYGTFQVTSVTAGSIFATGGVTTNETGSIQSLDEPAGPVTLPGAFMTFSAGGSTVPLTATNIPAGTYLAGEPLTLTQVSQGVLVSLEVDGYIGSNPAQNPFFEDITIGLAGQTLSSVFNNLPINGAFCATVSTSSPATSCNPFPAAPTVPEPSYALPAGAGLLAAFLVFKRKNAKRA